jgi:hypothetical protein
MKKLIYIIGALVLYSIAFGLLNAALMYINNQTYDQAVGHTAFVLCTVFAAQRAVEKHFGEA